LRKNWLSKHLFIALIFFFSGFYLQLATAQTGMFIEDISSKTNLPEGTINCISQDEYGFLWIGTYRGLFRYDGYQMINFSTINPQFKAFKIKTTLIDQQNLWVGTLASGLIKINLTNYSITHYNKKTDPDKKISDDNVLSIAVLKDHQVLAGTEWGGFNIINSSGIVSEIITTDQNNTVLSSPFISAICPFNNDNIMLGNNSLIIYNIKDKSYKKILAEVLNSHIYKIDLVGENEFIIYSANGLYSVTIKNGNPKYEKISNERIKAALILHNSTDPTILLGTNEGFSEYNIRSKQWKTIITEPFSISPQNITSFFNTRDDVLLVGSEDGFFSISSRKKHFRHYTSDPKVKTPYVISNIVKSDNNLFAGTWGKGILKLNKKTQSLENIEFTSTPELKSGFIYSMLETNNTIWFSTKDNLGIFKFNDNQSPYNLTYYSSFPDQNNQFRNYTVTTIFERSDKSILLGTWEGLLFYYDRVKESFIPLKDRLGNLPLLRDFSIFSIVEDQQGNIWAGGNGAGVLKMKIEGNEIISQQLFTEKDGLTSNYVTTIYISRNNKIWIGTDAGLTKIENNNFIKTFDKDIVYSIQSIIEDPIGYLWIGTQKGMLRINSNNTEESVRLFETTDGLNNRSFYLNSICRDADNTLYFGGYNGIDYFIPYKIDYNFNKPIPRITNFYLFNDRIFPYQDEKNQIIENIITSSESINLKYNQNTFSFEFANLEYQIPEKCQFAYMLEGVDKEWNFRDANNRIAYYTKLAPGTYTFNVKSSNNDGVWCDKPTTLTIVINPPFWASTWSYIIYFILSMLTIFSFIYQRIMKEQEKHNQLILELEYKKQKELDELKLRFFTNISHEFRTPLTLILGPLTKLLENDKNDNLKEKHLMIYRNASRLLQLTNRIMDFRKNEQEQLKLKVEQTNVSDFIYNIYLFFNYEAQKRKIDYRFKTEFEDNILIDQEFIESVTFNLLSNAFKYTPDNKSITISLKANNQNLLISFADTGRGISAEHLEHIFDRFYSTTKRNSAGIGLSFSKRLIEMHKGDILVESEYGKGSKFTVVLPISDVYSENEKAQSENKEIILDWKRMDQSLMKGITSDFNFLKDHYDKGEMIALVVDDNFEVRQFIRSLLTNNFNVLEASNGKEALELAFENIPDIIISDIMMPEMDGLEMCQILKTDVRTDHVPIILTTVLSAQSDRLEGLAKGADSYIPKPIDPNHLMIRVKKLVEKQLKLKDKFNLSDYSTSKPETEIPKEEVNPLVEKAREIVLKNLDNSEYNIDDFCVDLGLSRMQLYRKFKAITGLSANSFIRKVRLHKAAEMLKTGKFTVKEVTYDVGFIDLKYFRKCFNDEFGVNPSEYAQIEDEDDN